MLATSVLANTRIGFLGAGNMGSAIIRGLVAAHLVPAQAVSVCDLDRAKVEALQAELGLSGAASVADVAARSDLLVVAVKPQGAQELMGELAPHVQTDRHCVVSIMAGVTMAWLATRLPAGTRLVRVMPNTPALVGAGMTAVSCGPAATEADRNRVRALFATLGAVVELEEAHMDAVTAISGSGPAYLFYVAECLTAAAADVGLPPPVIPTLVRQTLLGASKLLAESEDTPETLRARVTSPGGTTAAAVAVLDAHGMRETWREAVEAARNRGAELAAQAE